jgi:K+-transporting ATPase KdpF subunit
LDVNDFLTHLPRGLINATAEVSLIVRLTYGRLNLRWNHHRVFYRERFLRAFLRKTLGRQMETAVVGIIALLLFVYLLVAMIRPEKF